MNYLMILFSLAFAGYAQADACKASITPDTPTSRFVLNNNGTAFDKKTGLTWMRCEQGQIWDKEAKTCNGSTQYYTWKQALNAAETANFSGFSDWRLPNIKELQSIVERCSFYPAINLTIFPHATNDVFWSASLVNTNSNYALIVDFSVGADYYDDKDSPYNAVRLVRGGQ
jgi:hypothetical protein